MLQFILGTGGTGKTALIHKKIEELARGGEQVLMLVPDQISFETEKRFLELLGARLSRNVTVFGFDGMCRDVFQRTRCVPMNVIDNGTRAVLMSAALEQLSEKLQEVRLKLLNTEKDIASVNGEIENSRLRLESTKERISTGRQSERFNARVLRYLPAPSKKYKRSPILAFPVFAASAASRIVPFISGLKSARAPNEKTFPSAYKSFLSSRISPDSKSYAPKHVSAVPTIESIKTATAKQSPIAAIKVTKLPFREALA